MSIAFMCPNCQRKMRVPDEAAGKKARCAKCGHVSDVDPFGPIWESVPVDLESKPVAPSPLPTKPAVGPRFSRPLRQPIKVNGCVGCLIIALVPLGAFTCDAWVHRRRGPVGVETVVVRNRSVVEAPRISGQIGDVVALGQPGMNGVWLATSDDDWDPMIDAENQAAKGGPGDGEALFKMSFAGRVRYYGAGTRVVIRKRSFFGAYVEVLDGEDKGRGGWIQSDLLRPSN